jgi:hypothetical protein
MSTHFTRRGGSPATDRDHDERARERRFRRDDADEPVSPLVAEQEDPALRRTAPVRDRATAPAAGSAAGWRSTVMVASGLNVLAGIWLIIAPFVLGYGSGDPIWNDVVFGAIVAFFALIRIAGAYRAEWLSWLNALIGAWVFASAFWLDSSGRAQWNDIILGAIVFVLGLISATARRETAYAERPWYGR